MELQGERHLVHPMRIFTTGRSKTGKSTEIVRIIDTFFRPQNDRLVICCPTWETQDTFDPIRDMIRNQERDILETDFDPFPKFLRNLKKQKLFTVKHKKKPIRTLLFVDDLMGTPIQGKRLSALSNLTVQARHLDLSIIIVSQQPKYTSPAIRQNCDAYICYPPNGPSGKAFIFEELNGNCLDKDVFGKLILQAWRGYKRKDDKEMNQHFLFVLIESRKPSRYFGDFTCELTPKKYRGSIEAPSDV
jgi:hypothetical protein